MKGLLITAAILSIIALLVHGKVQAQGIAGFALGDLDATPQQGQFAYKNSPQDNKDDVKQNIEDIIRQSQTDINQINNGGL